LQRSRRPLSSAEKKLLKMIYHNALALYNIRVWDGSGFLNADFFGIGSSAKTIGNNIYLNTYQVPPDWDVLVHESVHVWQYQHHGPSYISQAIVEHLSDDAYNWQNDVDTNPSIKWDDLDAEKEAEFIEDLYLDGILTCNSGTHLEGEFFEASIKCLGEFRKDGKSYTDLANDAVNSVRGSSSWTLSRLFN
jgi:hypothetical protein